MPNYVNSGRRKFIIGAGGLVVAGLVGNYFFRNKKNELVQMPLDKITDFNTDVVFDVCIIGSGPAGAVLGAKLVEAGKKVLMIESGLNPYQSEYDPRIEEVDKYDYVGDLDYPLSASRMRALGGTSNLWTGRCSRFHPIDFENNAFTPPGMDWPVKYDELEKYLQESEEIFRVRGDELSKFHAPRKSDLPISEKKDISGLRELMGSIGVTIDSSPTSTSPAEDGPVRVARDFIPSFLINQNAHLLSGVTVTKLNSDSAGNITSASIGNFEKEESVIQAKQFVVACGAVESARLLLLSKSESHPNGLGNNFDNVGRYFNEHPNIGFNGKIEHNLSTLSPAYELARCHQFYDQLKKEGSGSALMVLTQSWVFPQDLKDWSIGGIIEKTKRMFGRLANADLQIGATLEMYPDKDNRVKLSESKTDLFGSPTAELHMKFTEQDKNTIQKTKDVIMSLYEKLDAKDIEEFPISWSHHHIGGCCMGNDPKTSVVDANLKVHGVSNLYVASSGTFVTGGAAHPTLTISAISLRLAEHLKNG